MSSLSEGSSTILDARFLTINNIDPLAGFPLTAPDGSVSAAPYSFEKHGGTGVSLIADRVTFGVNGQVGMLVDMEANVALGSVPSDYGATTPGEGVLFVSAASTVPTSAASGGGLLYVSGSSLDFLTPTGSVIHLSSKTGDVFGPVASTPRAVATFDGATGKLLQDSFLLTTTASSLLAPDGSSAFNTYTFTGDEDTGMSLASAGVLQLTTGASSQVQLSTGAVTVAVTGVESTVPDGTAGAPAYNFSAAPTSGVFLNGTDVNVSVSGTTGLVVENVGGAVPNAALASAAPSDYGAGTPGVGVVFLPEVSVVPSGVPNLGYGSVLYTSSDSLISLNSAGVTRDLTKCAEETSGTTTLNGVVRFSGTTGKILQDTSSLTVDAAGQWAGPDATDSVVTYGFSGDPNTGMYSSGVGVVNFATGGGSRLSVSSSSIGIERLLLPDGSPTAPSISFSSNATTGMYYDTATDSVCMTSNGKCGLAIFDTLNVAVGGSPTDQFGGGEAVVWLREATVVPTSNPSGGGLLYADSAELKLRTPSGAVFALTDHVTGPGSATDEALVLFDGTSGKLVQNGVVTGTTAGKLLAGDGLVSAPAYSFTSDPDTGMYISGTDVSLVAGGSAQLTVDGSSVTCASPMRAPFGSASAPSFSFSGDTNTGVYRGFTNRATVSVGGTPGVAVQISGSGTNVSLTGTASFAAGENVVYIEEVGVVPVGTLTSGGLLYVDGIDLKFHDDSGAVSTLNGSPTSFIDGPSSSVVDAVTFWGDTSGTVYDSGSVLATSTQLSATGYRVSAASNTDITLDTSRLSLTAGTGNSVLVGSSGVEVVGIPLHADLSLRVGGASGVSASLSGSVLTSNHQNAAGTFEWRRDGSQIMATTAALDLTTPNAYVFPNSTEQLTISNTSATSYTIASTTSGGTADNISLFLNDIKRGAFLLADADFGDALLFPLRRVKVSSSIVAQDGSLVAPAYTFRSANQSGLMYDTTTSSVGLVAGSALSMVVSEAAGGTETNVAAAVSSFPTTYNGGVRVMYIGEVITEPTSDESSSKIMYVSSDDNLRWIHAAADDDQNSTLNALARRASMTLNWTPGSGSAVNLDGETWTQGDVAGVTIDRGVMSQPDVETTVMITLQATWASNSTGYRSISIVSTNSYTKEATSAVEAVNGDTTSHSVSVVRRIEVADGSNVVFSAEVFQNSGAGLNVDLTMTLVRLG